MLTPWQRWISDTVVKCEGIAITTFPAGNEHGASYQKPPFKTKTVAISAIDSFFGWNQAGKAVYSKPKVCQSLFLKPSPHVH